MEYNNDNRQDTVILNGVPQSGGPEKPKRKTGRIVMACIGFAAAAAMIIVFALGIVDSAPQPAAGSASTKGQTDITAAPGAEDEANARGTISYSKMTYQRPELGEIFDLIDSVEEYSAEADYDRLTEMLDEVYKKSIAEQI